MSREHLAAYLNDHLTGAAAAIELVTELAEETAELHSFFTQLKADIESDRDEVVRLMNHLDIPQSRLTKVKGWIAEQVAENTFAMEDQNLRRLERLEALFLGIEGKLRLWRALEAVSTVDADLATLNYARLAGRAQYQRDEVEKLRIQAANSALIAAA
jgi:hypothetical protein